MVVVSGFCERAQMAHAFKSPELSWAFEAALSLPASRLDVSRADGPAATVDGSVVHPSGMGRKIVLLAHHHMEPPLLPEAILGTRG